MTMGPAPMIRIDLMSVRLGIDLHNLLPSFGRAAQRRTRNPDAHAEFCSGFRVRPSDVPERRADNDTQKKGALAARPSVAPTGFAPARNGCLDQNIGAGKGFHPAHDPAKWKTGSPTR